MAIKDKDKDKIKPNKPTIGLDFGSVPPPPPKESSFSFKNMETMRQDQNLQTASNKNKFNEKILKQGPKDSKGKDTSKVRKIDRVRNKFILMSLLESLGIKKTSPYLESSVSDIAKILSVSKRTVQNYLRAWEESKLLNAVEDYNPSSKLPRKYRIDESVIK